MLARERVGGIPAIRQDFEAQGAGVNHEQSPDEAFAEAHDFADDFQRHQGAEHTGERAQDTRLGTGRNAAGRRRLRE